MTANEEIENAYTRHEVYVLRYSNSTARAAYALLKRLKSDVRALMREQGAQLTKAQLKRFRAHIREMYRGEWGKVKDYLAKEFTDLAFEEADFTKKAIERPLPVKLDLSLPDVESLERLSNNPKVSGKTVDLWLDDLREDNARRVADVMEMGAIQGLAMGAILKQAEQLDRVEYRNLNAIVRTANKQVSSAVMRQIHKKNKAILNKVRFVATLDGRTTLICASYDGSIHLVDKAPVLPLHWGCRSELVPYVSPVILGDRPSKPAVEKRMLKDFCRKNKLTAVSSLKDLPYGYKTAYSVYKRREIAKLVGRVPAKTTYSEWLKKQSHEFQDDVLGETRAKLFREGGLPLTRFVDHSTQETYTLETLRKSDSRAFEKAGLTDSDD